MITDGLDIQTGINLAKLPATDGGISRANNRPTDASVDRALHTEIK
jgi:hypothetical protein